MLARVKALYDRIPNTRQRSENGKVLWRDKARGDIRQCDCLAVSFRAGRTKGGIIPLRLRKRGATHPEKGRQVGLLQPTGYIDKI